MHIALVTSETVDFIGGAYIEQPYRAVSACGEGSAAVGGKGHAEHSTLANGMKRGGTKLLAGLDAPETHGLVVATGEQERPVG
jgi:hypothetical protein